LEIDALDLQPVREGFVLWTRLGGLAGALPARLERLKGILGECQVLQGTEDEQLWRRAREMFWVPEGWSLVKVPLTPGRIPALETDLASKPILRRYVAGGQVAWLALGDALQTLDDLLRTQDLTGLVLIGPPGKSRLGVDQKGPFYRRIKTALDPLGCFAEV
jgi:hypothetical protein